MAGGAPQDPFLPVRAMTVAVLIVNWNGGPLLRECLLALEMQQRRPDHVVVVDNASTDESLVLAQAQLQNVELLKLPQNVGFARANNLAARAASRFDAIALLNPDAFPEPGWLLALVTAAERHPSYSAFASQIVFAADSERLDGAGDSYHVSGRAWRNGHQLVRTAWDAADADVFAPCAAAALYRRDAFEDAGGFDESYFCYFEDVDLGFRLRLRGHRCLYVHAAVVRHVSSASTGYRSDFAVYHGERNAVWTFVKNMPAPLLWLYLPQHLVLNVAVLAYYPFRRQGKVALRAKVDALRGLGAALRRRWTIQSRRLVDSRTLRRAMRRGVTTPYFSRYASGDKSLLPPSEDQSTLTKA
jgi:GT2 family glycosyltransferase